MRKLLYLLTIIILISTTSCSRYKDAKRLLYKAQTVLDASPDTALACLDSIILPEKYLSKEEYMEFLMAKTQAKYKTYRDIKDDTAIFEACRYYEKRADNLEMITTANLYSGCVYEERNDFDNQRKNRQRQRANQVYEELSDFDKSMTAYKQSFEAAIKTGDSLIMGKIQQYMGILLSRHGLHEEAVEALKKSASYNKGRADLQANSFALIGNNYLIINENDSAFLYHDKGLNLAKQSGNSSLYSRLLQNIGIACLKSSECEKSEKYLRLSMQMNNDSAEIIRYHLSFAQLYLLMDEKDSCLHYENQLKSELDKVKDNFLLASIYSFLSNKAASENKYDTAFVYIQKYSEKVESITKNRLQQNVYEVQKKYDYERIKNDYNQRLLKDQRLILVMIVLIAIAIIVFTVRRSQKRKKELAMKDQLLQYESENARLTELRNNQEDKMLNQENEIERLKKNIDSGIKENLDEIDRLQGEIEKSKLELQETEKSLQINLQWKYMLVYNVAATENDKRYDAAKRYEKIKQMIEGMNNTPFDAIMYIFDEAHPGMAEAIRKNHPDLSETEYKVCILSFSPFTSHEIAVIIGQSVNTVNNARTSIRKKLKIEEKGGDIKEFLLKNV